jgi:hypothetical protein
VAGRHDTTPGAVAIAWTVRNPAVDGAIAGFRRADQVDPILAAASIELTGDDVDEIEARTGIEMNDTRTVTTSGDVVSASRRDYILAAAVLLATMVGGTLPIPLYVLYEQQMGFGPLGITVVFAAYVIGTLSALVAFGDLSDHIGRKKVLAIAVGCAAVSTALFLAASGIGVLIAARIVKRPGGGVCHRDRYGCAGRAPAARGSPGGRGGGVGE